MLDLLRKIEDGQSSWKDLTQNMSDAETENALAHINLLSDDELIKGMRIPIHGHVLWQDLELTGKGHDYLEQHSMQTAGAGNRPQAVSASSRKVFVVHGHDEFARESVARFLERIGFEAIILDEQANRNRTVIEKVEAHGDVGFAVVLLTPDDEGCTKGDTLRPRARQNVILELGYFVGRLGRERVSVLRRGEVEIPSDFGGVVYEPFDPSGGWKSKLAKELEAAEYAIDWAKVHS
jgi:predicted nucleotide-binding protein